MTDDDLLADLLLRWEELHDQGQAVTAEELCQDRPELTELLRQRIQDLQRIAWIKKPVEDVQAQSPAVLAGPGQHRTLAGRYRLDYLIGEGGFGQVWKAFDLELHRPVAVKVPKPSRQFSSEEIESFVAEARKVAQLRHPGIVAVHDICRSGGAYFFVTDWIDGSDLAGRLRQGPLPRPEAVRLVAEVARIMAYAHSQGFVHRDIKPANILLDSQGHPLVCDFGIAATEQELLHEPQRLLATLAYGSPEQIAGQPVDARCDIYSLGVVLFELLAGRLPFDDPDPVRLRERVLARPAPSLRSLNPAIPKDLERICLKCLAKNPADRYSTAQALADALDASLRYRRGWTPAVLAGAALIVLALALLLTWQSFRPPVSSSPGDQKDQDQAAESKDRHKVVDRGESPPSAELRCFQGHTGPVRCVAFQPNGKLVASGGADATVRLWSLDGPEKAIVLKQTTGVSSLAFTRDGKGLACGYDNGNIRLWDVAGGSPKEGVTIPAHKGSVTALAFSADKRFLVSGGSDGAVRLLVMGQAKGAAIPRHAGPVLSLTFASQGSKFTAGYQGEPSKPARILFSEFVFDKGSLKIASGGLGILGGVHDVRFMAMSDDGSTLLAATARAVHVWKKGKDGLDVVGAFNRNPEPVSALGLSPDSRLAISSGSDHRLRLWDVGTLNQVQQFIGHNLPVRCVAFSADGDQVASGDDGGAVRLWRIKMSQ